MHAVGQDDAVTADDLLFTLIVNILRGCASNTRKTLSFECFATHYRHGTGTTHEGSKHLPCKNFGGTGKLHVWVGSSCPSVQIHAHKSNTAAASHQMRRTGWFFVG